MDLENWRDRKLEHVPNCKQARAYRTITVDDLERLPKAQTRRNLPSLTFDLTSLGGISGVRVFFSRAISLSSSCTLLRRFFSVAPTIAALFLSRKRFCDLTLRALCLRTRLGITFRTILNHNSDQNNQTKFEMQFTSTSCYRSFKSKQSNSYGFSPILTLNSSFSVRPTVVALDAHLSANFQNEIQKQSFRFFFELSPDFPGWFD